MIKILLADDHAIMRSGLKDILLKIQDFEVIEEACNGTEVLEKLRQRTPDVLLTDLSMPGIGGIDLIDRVKTLYPTLPVLVLTMFNDAQMASRIIKVGAEGYLTKDCSPEELINGVRKVAAGGKCIDPKMAEQILFNTPSTEIPHSKLSNRELDVLRLFLKGVSVNKIADQLCISNKTVSTHKATMLRKMGMSNTTELVRYAVQYDLFSSEMQ
ncbi:MAG: response regulator transcription factor [Gallionellaceae bacterium]|jgi:DNA-binding NarL/FixJ family response regulator